VDLVSYVAVRARNASLLFATCYDQACFDQLKAMKGHVLQLAVTPAGDVAFVELKEPPAAASQTVSVHPVQLARPSLSAHPLRRQDFDQGLVGSKSSNLKALAEKMPEWIHVPRSVALPFGAFDVVLEAQVNESVAERYRTLLGQIEANPSQAAAELRQCLMGLQVSESLKTELRQVTAAEGLPWPDDWAAASRCLKQVWASKWNDRAYFSRRARRLPHESVHMAVLIQEVVEAEYAFVIHTVNPFTRDRAELYAEVVLGLGETLVGNYPGRALSFVSSKADPKPALLSYPGKSIGLYGGGLIFRSDSNAEDLAGYAAAGLYDSVLLRAPREQVLNYADDPLVWDESFRTEFLATVARIGLIVEQAFGTPQDIEGACAKGRFSVVQTRPQVGLGHEG